MQANGHSVVGWRGSVAWHDLVPRLLAEHGSKTVVEVGVWQGVLSERILKGCPKVKRLTLVDPWMPVYGYTKENKWFVIGPGNDAAEMRRAMRAAKTRTAPFGKRVKILRLPSVDAAKKFDDGSLDAVLIDAVHLENTVIEDIMAWMPKLRTGGVMIGDDFGNYYPGVELGVRAMFGDQFTALGQTWWTFPHEVKVNGS